jgi:hypothetical protein
MPLPSSTDPDRDERFRDGLGVRVAASDQAGDAVEHLRVSPELAMQESALRDRVGRLVNFRHAKYVRLRGVDRAKSGTRDLFVSYDTIEGDRLSTILATSAHHHLTIEIDVALQIVRDLLPAIGILHDSRKVTHGAIAPERLVLTTQNRLVIVDHGFGAALARLNLARKKFWDQLRIASPPSTKVVFDEQTDVVQIGIVALSLLVGRPLTDEDFPGQLKRLILGVKEASSKVGGRPISPDLRRWLERALALDEEHPYRTVREAQEAFETLVAGARYSPSAAAVKAFLTRYREVAARAAKSAEAPAASGARDAASSSRATVDRALEELSVAITPRRPPAKKSTASLPAAQDATETTAAKADAAPAGGNAPASDDAPGTDARKSRGRLDALQALENELSRLASLDVVVPAPPLPAASQPNEAAAEAPPQAQPAAEAVAQADAAPAVQAKPAGRRPFLGGSIDAELDRLMGERDPNECATPTFSLDASTGSLKPAGGGAELTAFEQAADGIYDDAEAQLGARQAPPSSSQDSARAADEAARAERERTGQEARDAAARAAHEEAERAAQEALAKSAREASERAAREAAARAAEEAAERAAREAAEHAAREAADRAAREAADRALAEEAARGAAARAKADREAREAAEREALEAAQRGAKERADRAMAEQAARDAAAKAAADREAREQAERQAKEAAERAAREQTEREAAERAAHEASLREVAAREAREAAERQVREAAERAARELAAHEAAERDARAEAARQAREAEERRARAEVDREARTAAEQQAREAGERANREVAEREAAEQAAREAAAREATEREARTLAERQAREAADRAAREAADRARAEQIAREAAARAAAAREARELAERQAREAGEEAQRESAAREALQQEAREASQRARREAAERESAQLAAREATARAEAEREARTLAQRQAREAGEQAEREAAEREAAERAAREASARAAAEREARELAERETRDTEALAAADSLDAVDRSRRKSRKAKRKLARRLDAGSSVAAASPAGEAAAPATDTPPSFFEWESTAAVEAVPAWMRGKETDRVEDAPVFEQFSAESSFAAEPAREATPPAVVLSFPPAPSQSTTPPWQPLPAEPVGATEASAPLVVANVPARRRVSVNWGRTLAASLVLAMLEGVAFAAAWWMVTPTELGWLIVYTRPTGINVSIDGKPHGQTPFAAALEPGRHTIELREGTATRVVPVEISAGVQTEQRISWHTGFRTGQARITSTPPGARVKLDGKSYGATPVTISELEAGRHEVTVEADSGSATATLIVEAGETTELEVPVFSGWVTVLSQVELEIRENGKLLGTTQAEKLMLAPGVHKLEFSNAALGYKGRQDVRVRPGATTSVSVLPKAPVTIEAPEGTLVTLDGEKLGEIPLESTDVPIGTREFVLKYKDEPERRQVVVVTLSAPVVVRY